MIRVRVVRPIMMPYDTIIDCYISYNYISYWENCLTKHLRTQPSVVLHQFQDLEAPFELFFALQLSGVFY